MRLSFFLSNYSLQNGLETDIDCGGPSCSPCPSGSKCLVDSDCFYNNCPLPASTTADPICVAPPKACPNDCGGGARGVCQYISSTSGATLNATKCLADTPTSTCRATCECFDGFGGDGCQLTDAELDAAVEVRTQSLLYIQNSSVNLDVSPETISRQATLLSKVTLSEVACSVRVPSTVRRRSIATSCLTGVVEVKFQFGVGSADALISHDASSFRCGAAEVSLSCVRRTPPQLFEESFVKLRRAGW